MHVEYRDIPDLDAGRIPYPISKRGRYSVGERKTVILILSDSFTEEDLEKTVRSLYSVLTHPSNRLFVDLLLVDWIDHLPQSHFSTLSDLITQIGDCVFQTLLVPQIKSSSHFTLIEKSLELLIKQQYEQLLLVNVFL